MKKVLAVLLTLLLTSSLTYGVITHDRLPSADASEQTVEASAPEEPLVEEAVVVDETDASPELVEPVIEPAVEAVVEPGVGTGDEAAAPDAQIPSGLEATEPQAEELPYWQADASYQALIDAYNTAVAAGHITSASITMADAAGAGMAGSIKVGDRTVISNGTNAPDYDNASGLHLTPREGYPQAGMTSDRSVLILVEQGDAASVYDATFYFGSTNYPEAPFTAFRTFVVLAADNAGGTSAEGESLPARETAGAVGELEDGSEEADTAELNAVSDEAALDGTALDGVDLGEEEAENASVPAKQPYATYHAAFLSAYYSFDCARYVLDASYTVGAVAEDGTVTGGVGSHDFAVTGVSGTAQVLTSEAPVPGQTSSYAYLTRTGSGYEAVFLFEGAGEGSAVGGLNVSLAWGEVSPVRYAMDAEPNIKEAATLSLLPGVQTQGEISPLAWDIPVGHTFESVLTYAGDWNGVINQGNGYGGTYTVTMYWEFGNVTFYAVCMDPGIWGPEAVSYVGRTVQCTVTKVDRMNGLIYVTAYIPGPSGYQRLISYEVPLVWQSTGELSILKASANPSITDGNACYTLQGAEYGVYRSWNDASVDANRVRTIVTDANGYGAATDLANGYYYVKEVKAPQGYALDDQIYSVTHETTHTRLNTVDMPLHDPTTMNIQKIDTETGEAYGKDDPNGYLLADGEFTIRYWDGFYNTVEQAEASGAPTRTWRVRTIQNGKSMLTNSLLIEGSDPLYLSPAGLPAIPFGTVAIQETKAPPGYLLPSPNPVNVQQIKATGNPLAPVTRLNTVIVKEKPREVIVEKRDADTHAPVPDTEFTLYQESSPGAGDWTAVSTHTTDEQGKCTFSPVAIGSYKLDETRTNPAYAELEESGDAARLFTIDENSTGEVQVFYNDVIQIAVDVYKKTIPLTNTALDGTKHQAGNHVGQESYLYHFGARSSSNVRVDEFVITDSLEYVTSKGYRMTTLWTGTAPEGMDYDGLMHILYKTNLTSPTEPVSFAYDPVAANPYNANNPGNNMYVSVESGWRVWQECVSTTTAVRLDVADLGLEEGEYIIGLRAVYGGVVKGFYTGTGWQDTDKPQSYEGDRDAISTLSVTDELGTLNAFELRNWSYEVVATDDLLPISDMGDETVMQGSIRADLFRNWGTDAPVLTDIAKDKVETRVISTFNFDKESLGITPGEPQGRFFGLPITGDSLWAILLVLGAVGIAGVILIGTSFRRSQKLARDFETKDNSHD